MAWQNLFEQTVANVKVSFDPGDGARDHTIDELLANMYSTDRPLRMRTLETLYGALEPLTPVLAHCYDSLVADRLVDDRLRSFDGPMAQRNLSNELENAAVEAMMSAIESRHSIAHRWYRRKAELLGVPKLHLSDQYAPLGRGPRVLLRRVARHRAQRVRPVLGRHRVGVGGVLRRPARRRRAARRASAGEPSARRSRRTRRRSSCSTTPTACAT